MKRLTLTGASTLALLLVAFASTAEPNDMPDGNSPPLLQQTFTVVQATGVDLKANSAFDIHMPVTLKTGQMLILKSASGQMIEIDGPYTGKPVDHYTAIATDGTMGYDAKSFPPPGHCSGGAPHPSGGPNPDETGGPEDQATHCQ